jgi:hypothetical protein
LSFCFATAIIKISWRKIHRWKLFSRPFQWYTTNTQISKISIDKPKKQICNRLATVEQAGKKKPQ